jgi:hypothetical protein
MEKGRSERNKGEEDHAEDSEERGIISAEDVAGVVGDAADAPDDSVSEADCAHCQEVADELHELCRRFEVTESWRRPARSGRSGAQRSQLLSPLRNNLQQRRETRQFFVPSRDES